MQQSSLVIPQLETTNWAIDLGNALIAVSGIGHIDINLATRTLTVEYDREHLSVEALKEFVKGAGYPSEGDESTS